MSGLDDLIGSLTKNKPGSSGAQGGLGLDDLLGGLLGGGRGESAGGGGREDLLGGLLGGGSSSARSRGGAGVGGLLVVLAPLLAKLLRGGGLSKLVQSAQANGLSAQADSWVGTGANQPVDPQQARVVVGDDTVQELAREAGISQEQAAEVLAQVVPEVVNGLSPNGQLPSDGEVDDFLAKFGA